jgi:hypothetical protein
MGTPAPSTLADLTVRVDELERTVRDHAQRFDTAQTHQWKRVWFWLQGWPMTDWNAPKRNWRPWHR